MYGKYCIIKVKFTHESLKKAFESGHPLFEENTEHKTISVLLTKLIKWELHIGGPLKVLSCDLQIGVTSSSPISAKEILEEYCHKSTGYFKPFLCIPLIGAEICKGTHLTDCMAEILFTFNSEDAWSALDVSDTHMIVN